jgi:hypothetical protein
MLSCRLCIGRGSDAVDSGFLLPDERFYLSHEILVDLVMHAESLSCMIFSTSATWMFTISYLLTLKVFDSPSGVFAFHVSSCWPSSSAATQARTSISFSQESGASPSSTNSRNSSRARESRFSNSFGGSASLQSRSMSI